jgi:nitrite reductase (cytochrome c-552)
MADTVDAGSEREPGGRRRTAKLIVVTALISALVAVGGVALLVTIFERKQGARNPFYRESSKINRSTTDGSRCLGQVTFRCSTSAYDGTVDQVRTKQVRGGSRRRLPRSPTQGRIRVQLDIGIERLKKIRGLKHDVWPATRFLRTFGEERGTPNMLD